jgi:hypothetical protein
VKLHENVFSYMLTDRHNEGIAPWIIQNIGLGKGKGRVHLGTGHEDPEGE